MNFDIRVSYDCRQVATEGGGENSSWIGDSTSMIMPKDIGLWAERFKMEDREITFFINEQINAASISIASCPQAEWLSTKEAEKIPSSLITFVLDLATLQELHAALGLAIANLKK